MSAAPNIPPCVMMRSFLGESPIIAPRCCYLFRYVVTLCRWSAKQTIPLSVLARNQTKGFGLEILAGPEVVTGREKRVGLEVGVGDGTRTRAVDTGDRSREASRQEIGSSDSERRSSQDESAFQLLCGSFARIHTSVSLHMHKVLHNSSSALELTPSVCSFVLFFSHSLDCI